MNPTSQPALLRHRLTALEQKERAAFDDNDLTTLGWKERARTRKVIFTQLRRVFVTHPLAAAAAALLCFALLCFAWGGGLVCPTDSTHLPTEPVRSLPARLPVLSWAWLGFHSLHSLAVFTNAFSSTLSFCDSGPPPRRSQNRNGHYHSSMTFGSIPLGPSHVRHALHLEVTSAAAFLLLPPASHGPHSPLVSQSAVCCRCRPVR